METTRILVVDDDEHIRMILKEFFTNIGYEVAVANGGEDALQKFVPGAFDMIISDLAMPDVDGLELLRQIKAKDSKVLFFMITGYPTLETAVEAMKQGAYDYVTKPFNMEDMRIKIERAFHAQHLEKSLKKINGVLWALVLSVPIWLILGIVVGFIWKRF
jgi:two-component system, NtrC family, response regulator PilR